MFEGSGNNIDLMSCKAFGLSMLSHLQFAVAEEIAQIGGAKDKIMDLEFQWAQHCEEKKDYEEARKRYINANMVKEAVDM